MIYLDWWKHADGKYYGHMISDTSEGELMRFALKIGLQRKWYQDQKPAHPHFDITTEHMRQKAIAAGATEVDFRELHRIQEARNLNRERKS